MNRSIVVAVCISAIVSLPLAAHAQGYPPPPPPPVYRPAPPPPQYYQPPPPPPYYAPPPSQYYAPPPPRYYIAPAYRPPSNGIGAIIAGSILLGVGIVLIGVSVPLWNDACGVNRTCFNDPYSSDYDAASGAVSLDVVGSILFVAGAILLPVGIVQASRYGRWRSSQRVQLAPSATGLKLTF
jgi:hypothetical protein